ncbi:MAG: hypothetical protein Q8O89_09045, partial [Nanoarchaeota archaeon]|nr:hypothetical protein [Nanoarchaeota archaeon]
VIMAKWIGKVTKFLDKIKVAVIEPSEKIKVGDKITIRGQNKLEVKVDSIQIHHKSVSSAEAGQAFGLKVDGEVREGDIVYDDEAE